MSVMKKSLHKQVWKTYSVELKLVRNRLRWLDHASRMDNDRPVKAFLYSELVNGTRPVGRPKLRYKNTCKNDLKYGCVLNQWRNTVDNRQEWRQLIYHKCEKVNQKRIGDYERKRESRSRKELQRQ